MSDQETWQWVDEDPIEKLIRPAKAWIEPEPPPQPVLAEPYLIPESAQVEEPHFDEHVQLEPPPPEPVQIEEPMVDVAVGSDFVAAVAEPELSSEHFNLAVRLEKTGQWKDAADFFSRAFEMDPSRYDALLGLGACLLHLGEAEEALDCFERHIKGDGGRAPTLLGKAVALHKLTRLDEAERTYHDVLQSDPNSAEALGNLIALSAARNDTAAISEYSHRLLDSDPRSKPALQGLATLAIRRGDQEAAVEYCERLVEVDPDNLEGWFNLGLAQQMMHPRRQDQRSIA